MKKNYLLATALAIMTMASCSDNDFVGGQETLNAKDGAIQFVSNTPSITRASGADAAEALGYKFKVYAVKKVGDDYSNVFAGNPYSVAADYNASTYAYWVWYDASTAGTTTSNTSNWDYVGSAASGDPAAPTYGTAGHEVALTTAQTIKYWDYAASQYEFVAYSATVDGATITKYKKDGFTIEATPAQLAGLYVADKLTLTTKDNTPTKPASDYNKIGDIVQFTFRSAAAKVRLGIYETIPGYEVQNVKFLPLASEFTGATGNAKLCGSFNGTSPSGSATFNVTYAVSAPQIAIFDAEASAGNYFDFGSFVTTAIGITSTAPTWATGSATYQSVFPNTDNPGNMTLYVDYELHNTVSGEIIKVNGAKAVVPAAYMTWNPNYAYTYLFKISDNTNGQTSTESGTPVGLYPITFDAVTIAAADGNTEGIITSVSTPHITTYQEGSVSAEGITYAHANGAIYITINEDGTLKGLTTDNTKLYTVADGVTEADLILTTKTKTPVTSGDDVLSILAADEKVQDITFTTGNAAKFTPKASTNYALEYLVSAAVNYTESQKNTYNATLPGAIASGASLTADQATAVNTAISTSYSEGNTISEADANSYNETLPGHKTTSDVKTPAVYQYKIIKVAAGGGSARLAK